MQSQDYWLCHGDPHRCIHVFLSGPLDMIATLSGKEIAAHVVLLMVLPLAGLILSIIGIRLKNSSASFIPSMSIVLSLIHI